MRISRQSGRGSRASMVGAAARLFAPSGSQPRSAAAANLIAKRIRGHGFELSRRERLFLLLEEPSSSAHAHAFSMLVRVATLLATMSDVLESIPWVVARTGHAPWLAANVTFFSLFIVEACARVTCYVPFKRVHRDPFIWLDILTVIPFLCRLLTAAALGTDISEASWGLHVFEAFGSIRLLKLCRYDEGAALLARAVSRSMAQLYVPLFMLLILVASCSTVLYKIEYRAIVDECRSMWLTAGVSADFVEQQPKGVTWDCIVCDSGSSLDSSDGSSSLGTDGTSWAAAQLTAQFCTTCRGYPDGHPECLGVPWQQTFISVPHAMWFVLVTVTTVGFGDVSPATWSGQVFIGFVILLGVVFLAMPLATVGHNFNAVWDERQLFKVQALVRQVQAISHYRADTLSPSQMSILYLSTAALTL